MSDIPETVVVTGAGRRIGRAIALDLAARGWRVAVHFHKSQKDADGVVDTIKRAGGTATALGADLNDWHATSALIGQAADVLGPVTCLINNASLFEDDNALTATEGSWDHHMDVNLRAPFALSQAMAKALPSGSRGNIVNIIDQRVWNLKPDFMSYTVSKVGLWGLTRILARGLAPDIRVNAVGPGPTLPSIHQSEHEFEEEWSALPLRRPVTIEDICGGVRFILEASAMTGQMIALDGGQHMGFYQESGDAENPRI